MINSYIEVRTYRDGKVYLDRKRIPPNEGNLYALARTAQFWFGDDYETEGLLSRKGFNCCGDFTVITAKSYAQTAKCGLFVRGLGE